MPASQMSLWVQRSSSLQGVPSGAGGLAIRMSTLPAGRAVGGHLAEGAPVFACEFVIYEYLADQTLARQNDPETGLMLWPK